MKPFVTVSSRALVGFAVGAALASSTPVRADVDVDFVNEYLYLYRVTHVPDHDQVRLGLPNNGTVHCVPTSAMNWMCYFANHGQPAIQPGPGNWQHPINYDAATNAILVMGTVMLTAPPGGTTGPWAVLGIRAWLHDWPMYVIRMHMTDEYSPRMQQAAIFGMGGGYVLVGVGWYLEEPGGLVLRDGGHSLSLNHAARDGALMQIGWRDPGSAEGDMTKQSPFTNEKYAVEDVLRYPFLVGGPRLMSKVVGYGGGGHQGYIDSFTAIMPMFTLTTLPDFSGLRRQHMISIGGGPVGPLTDFPFPIGYSVRDMALHPDNMAVLLMEDDGGAARLFFLDLLTGVFAPADDGLALTNPTEVAIGRRRDVYIVDGNELVRVNADVDPPAEVSRRTLPVPVGPMAYDDLGDNVLMLAPGTRQILAYKFNLDVGPAMFAIPPAVPIGSDPRICWNLFDGSGWLVNEGSSILWRMVISPDTGEVTAQALTHPSITGPVDDLQIGDFGRVLACVGSAVMEFDYDGMTGSLVPSGQPWCAAAEVYGGPLLVPTSRTNWIAAIHDTDEWRDVMPDEFAEPEYDCDADVVENGVVDVDDLVEVILCWAETGGWGGFIRADVNQDAVVDVDDLLDVILAWGPC